MKSFIDLANEHHPHLKKRHDRFHDNTFSEGGIDPLKALALEGGYLLDGHQKQHALFEGNYQNIDEPTKEGAHQSYHDLLEALMPLVFHDIIDKHQTEHLRSNHKEFKNFLKKHLKSDKNKIKEISPHMIFQTDHHHKHYDQAIEYILENAIDGVDEKMKFKEALKNERDE